MQKDRYKLGATEYLRQFYRKYPQKYMWSSAKQRAKKRSLEFTITPDDIQIPTHCPILGCKLGLVFQEGGSAKESPSLDRKDSRKGYTPENIGVISQKANRLKSDLTPIQIQNMCDYVSGT